MADLPRRRSLRGGAVWTLLLAALWLALAVARPGATFHLAPLLVGAAPAALVSLGPDATVGPRGVAVLSVFGFATATLAAGLLAAGGRLDGVALAPFPTAAVEAIAFGGVGALGGGIGALAVRRLSGRRSDGAAPRRARGFAGSRSRRRRRDATRRGPG